MNCEDTIANLGLALGNLKRTGGTQVLINGKWHDVIAVEESSVNTAIRIEDILLLLQAEEVA
jgi:hypothetical protein